MTKQLSLYKIRDMALDSEISVFGIKEFATMINKNRNIATVYMNRLIKNHLAIKLMNGKIAFTDDIFIIASQLINYTYISLNTALEFHNISNQVTKNIECVTTVNSIKFTELGIEYHKIKPDLFFGYKRYNKGKSYIFVATPEKAVVDGLYLGIFHRDDLEEFKKNIDFISMKKTLSTINVRGIKKIIEALQC